jgi:hypothetical protein
MKWRLILLLAAALSARADTYVVTAAGLGGEPDYEQRFAAWAQDIGRILKSETLYGPAATRERLRAVLGSVAQKATPQDEFILILIGHGAYDGVEYKFTLPGADISATELAALLNRIKAEKQLVVNATSASGGALAVLKADNRVVVTATKSGTERNATVFARYWLEALRDPAADTDKNETITALEAFQYAEQKTKNFYETQKRLATEHPQLADGAQGLAGRFILVRFGSVEAALKDPAKRALIAKKEDLEQQIDKLKYEKAAMPTPEYKKQLTALLLELAKVQAELDK